jgi:hypothetical protein
VTLVIGTDEAGYGPNLGPLVIAATAWRMTAGEASAEEQLASAVARAAYGLWGDSKKIYRGGAGFGALEHGALVAATLTQPDHAPPTDWHSLAAVIDAGEASEPPEQAFVERLSLPRYTHEPCCRDHARTIAGSLEAAGVEILAVRCRIIQPIAFNAMLATGLNKSDILSQVTLDVAATLATRATPDEPCLIWCDRHGGRRRYAPLVGRAFGLPLVRPLEETATTSCYALPPAGRIEFTVGGEARIPVAAASMTAKYVRELSMLAFNEFWGQRLPGLAATAGYPVDAARWRRDAAGAVTASGIPWDAIWRRA